MLKCREIAAGASDYIDAECGPWRRLQFAMHLLMCGHCRRFVRQLRLTVAVVRRMPGNRLSPADASLMASRIRASTQQQPKGEQV